MCHQGCLRSMGVKKPPAEDHSLGCKRKPKPYQSLGNNWQLGWQWVGSSSDSMLQCKISTCFCLVSSWFTSDSRAVLCVTMHNGRAWGWGNHFPYFCCHWWAAELSQGIWNIDFAFPSAEIHLQRPPFYNQDILLKQIMEWKHDHICLLSTFQSASNWPNF